MNRDLLPRRGVRRLRLLGALYLILAVVGLSLPVAEAQVINTGPLFISSNEIVTIEDDFIQADRSQQTTNQGTLLISGTLRFVDGVINEVGGILHGGWFQQPGEPQERPDFHTIFRAGAQAANPSAALDGGGTDALIDGPVRRTGGGTFVFPTGDVSAGQAYRGLLGLEAPPTQGMSMFSIFGATGCRTSALDWGPFCSGLQTGNTGACGPMKRSMCRPCTKEPAPLVRCWIAHHRTP